MIDQLILSDKEYAKLRPADPREELRKAIECAAARAPEDYTSYYLLRGILVALIVLIKCVSSGAFDDLD